MRIGILTQPLINNYGGILQNFALQCVVKSLGHTPTTLNFAHSPLRLSPIHLAASITKRLLHRILGKNQKYINPYKEDKAIFTVAPEQQRFINKYISKVDLTNALTRQDKLVGDFDAFIVGSDQIWRPLYSPNIQNYFLDFTLKTQRKIAYAASFGTDNWEFSDELTEYAKILLKDFDGISVREESGIRLCKDYLECNSEHVLDPTLLLSANDYIALLSLEEKIDLGLSTYILDDSPSKQLAIANISEKYNLRINKLGDIRNGRFQSIEQWLNDIRNSKFIITDSFHGTVFSILFHKQFATFYNPERGNSRMKSLLKSVGLESHLVETNNVNNALCHIINWDEVENKLNTMRSKSLSFLQSSINGK